MNSGWESDGEGLTRNRKRVGSEELLTDWREFEELSPWREDWGVFQ
jgi:hypothetical protein